MNKNFFLLILLVAGAAILPLGAVQAQSVTVATFLDPSANSLNPVFTVDWTAATVNGMWADSKTGLNLDIPISGLSFSNAWFQMSQLAITSTQTIFGQKYGQTGPGQISFYADGTSTNPVLLIEFQTGTVGRQFLAGDDIVDGFYADTVTITGPSIPYALSYEIFSFSFANIANLTNGHEGFTSTSAFTSSAIPEPATMVLLGLGGLLLARRK